MQDRYETRESILRKFRENNSDKPNSLWESDFALCAGVFAETRGVEGLEQAAMILASIAGEMRAKSGGLNVPTAETRLAALRNLCNEWECQDNTGDPIDVAINELIERFRNALDSKAANGNTTKDEAALVENTLHNARDRVSE
jgi:hypothetical protein